MNIFDVILGSCNVGEAWALSMPNVRGEGPSRRIATRSSDRLEKFCEKYDEPGQSTYFCVSTIEEGAPRQKEHARQSAFLFCDIDFKDHDTPPDEILNRFLAQRCPPSRVHGTGGGYHNFWFLGVPVGPDQFERFERLLKRIADIFGGDPSVCHRVALLRVPGTTNTKRDQPKRVTVIRNTDTRYSLEELEEWLDSFNQPVLVRRGSEPLNAFERMGQVQGFKPPVDVEQRLKDMRRGGVGEASVHATQLSCTASLMSAGVDVEEIVETIITATKALDGTDGWNWTEEERAIRGMCRDYERKFGKEKRPASLSVDVPVSLKDATGSKDEPSTSRLPWRGMSKAGEPRNTLHNARVALNALNVKCKYDVFQSRIYMGYDGDVSHELQQVVGEVSDDAVIALRRICSDEFGANFTNEIMLDAVRSIALDHRYDPVCDELDAAEAGWDGQPRLERMAVDYLNAADEPLNRAFIRKTMIAAVRRARHRGCKFDTITVLESPEGWNKSGFWRVLAGDNFYSDQSIIGHQAREVQEQLSTVWIHENAELAGMRKTEVEIVKAYASRQTDIARPAYGRVVKRQPRHSIDVGTTNADTYLQSQTGNRRFWPIKVTSPIDLDKLKRDRLQLLGEAAAYESQGEEITLDPLLWAAAAVEQDARRITDPWEEILGEMPTHAIDDGYGRIECFNLTEGQPEERGYIKIIHRTEDQAENRECVATATILKYVLRVPQERQTTAITMRLGVVMRQLGWEKHANKITIDGKQVRGFSRRIPSQ
jgi:predicted P-loop ATPase